MLLLIYINDLTGTTKAKVWLFANKADIYLAVSSLEDAPILQQDLNHLHLLELE